MDAYIYVYISAYACIILYIILYTVSCSCVCVLYTNYAHVWLIMLHTLIQLQLGIANSLIFTWSCYCTNNKLIIVSTSMFQILFFELLSHFWDIQVLWFNLLKKCFSGWKQLNVLYCMLIEDYGKYWLSSLLYM